MPPRMVPGIVQGEGGTEARGPEAGGPEAGGELGYVETKDDTAEEDDDANEDAAAAAAADADDDVEVSDAKDSRLGEGKVGDPLVLGDVVGPSSVETAVYRRIVSATLSVPQTRSEKPPSVGSSPNTSVLQ